jgi:predicted permease
MWPFRRRRDAELDEEVRAHLAMAERDRVERGESPDAARYAARREFGNVGLVMEITREIWGWQSVERLVQDVRYGVRSLRRSPAFTVTAILTMTIGIGLSTAMFTAFNAVALRGWPAENADALVLINTAGAGSATRSGLGLDDLDTIQKESRSLDVVAAARMGFRAVSLEPDAEGQRIYGQYVTPGYFEATGVRMALGRNFHADEDRHGAPAPVIIISHGLWQRLFGGAADVIGKSLYLGAPPNIRVAGEAPAPVHASFVIIGVTREGWRGGQPYRDDFWLPLETLRTFAPGDALFSFEHGRCCAQILGRLAPGVSRDEAAAELNALAGRAARGPDGRPRRIAVSGTSMLDRMTGSMRVALPLLVLAGTIIVLLLTGANIAHLQLARAMARSREIRTRMAIGASRARVARQLLTEALLLSVVAGVLGMAMVYLTLDTLMTVAEMPMPEIWAPDIKVFAYCIGVSLAMSLVFSLVPAMRSTKVSLAHGLGVSAPGRKLRFNLVLLATQIALSTSLLTGASLLSRAFAHATTGDVGYPLSGLTVATFLPGRSDGPAAEVPGDTAALTQALERATAESGLAETALVEQLPFTWFDAVNVRRPGDNPASAQALELVRMSSSAFPVIGIPLAAGRLYADRAGAAEAIVNQTAARLLWPGESALGKTLVADGASYSVVGVARDVHFTSYEVIGPTLHLPLKAGGNPSVVVRAEGPAVAAQLTAVLTGLHPRATVSVRTLSERLAYRHRDGKAGAKAAWAGGLLALALATFGVFGIFAYAVEERRREIGIRFALGAQKGQVLAALFRTSHRAVLVGLGVGLLLSLSLGPLLEQVLLGLSPFDPIAFGIVAAILSGAGVVATFIPARRALNVAPAVILKLDS